jgi:hypothetical protein
MLAVVRDDLRIRRVRLPDNAPAGLGEGVVIDGDPLDVGEPGRVIVVLVVVAGATTSAGSDGARLTNTGAGL